VLLWLVLGLDEKIGNFELGKEFDAVLVEPRVARSKFIVTNFDSIQVQKLSKRQASKNLTNLELSFGNNRTEIEFCGLVGSLGFCTLSNKPRER